MRLDKRSGRLRETVLVEPSPQFDLLNWGISSGFPSADHFDLPGSQVVFSTSQNPPGYAHSS